MNRSSSAEGRTSKVQDLRTPRGSRAQPPLADGATVVLAVGAFLSGAAIGLSGPLFVVAIVVTLVAGPTLGGIALIAAIVIGAVASAGVVVGLMVGRRPYIATAVVVACAALVGGILGGAWYGDSVRLAGWAAVHATPRPTQPWSMPPTPRFLEAHADVTLRLDVGADFVPSPVTGGPDGTFGHWCQSGPDTTQLADVSAIDVARLGTATVWADLRLTNPSSIDVGSAIAFPRLVLQVRYDGGARTYVYAGSVGVVQSEAHSGRVVFDALAGDPAPPGYPAAVSGELAWVCRDWAPQ